MPKSPLLPYPFWDELEAEHCSWLSAFDPRHLRSWNRLRKNDKEAALCEAATRRLLEQHSIRVEPNEELTPSGQQPDFLCTHPDGTTFLVEVACIPIDKATEETGLPYPFQSGCRAYRHLNDAFFAKSKGKTTQCTIPGKPTLVAVGTLHDYASMKCIEKMFADMLLVGETNISWMVNTQTGAGVGDVFQSTSLYSAPFFGQGREEISDSRCSISGMLLCGFGISPPRVLGILHQCAARPFNPCLLPGIAFGEVQVNRETGQFRTSWSGGNSADEETGQADDDDLPE